MFLIALRIALVLAISYLFGLLVAWLFSLFKGDDDGWDRGSDEPTPPVPPGSGKTFQQEAKKKRLIEVDESYYLEEFDLSNKK